MFTFDCGPNLIDFPDFSCIILRIDFEDTLSSLIQYEALGV